MSESINTVLPDKPLSGASLMRSTVAGRKTRFVQDTNIATASFTIPSAGIVTINFNLALFPEDLPSSQRTVENIVAWADSVAWPYADFFVDSDLDENMLLPDGDSLSLGEQSIFVDRYHSFYPNTYSGSTKYSATTRYIMYNNDSSSHVIYFYGRYKLIIYGEELL